jgi:hypothetical protein
MDLVWNRVESMAWCVPVGGILGLEHYVDAGRNGRVDGYLALDPGYSRRREIVPLLERVGMQSPWRID